MKSTSSNPWILIFKCKRIDYMTNENEVEKKIRPKISATKQFRRTTKIAITQNSTIKSKQIDKQIINFIWKVC